MNVNNPFLITGYYGPDTFCDRDRETDALIDALYNCRNVTLTSPRRMGKTGLIKHAFHILNQQEEPVVTLYLDIFATRNLQQFVKVFSNAVLGKLDSAPQRAVKRITRFVRSCRPVMTFDEMTGAPKISVDFVSNDYETMLKEVFDYLKSADRRCYIAIDEFQQIADYPEKGVEALLRSYVQFVPNVQFIFSGSRQHMMEEMFLSAKKPFYQSTQMMGLGSIDRRLYHEFALEHFERSGRSIGREVFDYIYDRYEGHTWYVQNILNRLYAGCGEISVNSAKAAEDMIIEENAYAYESLVRAYPEGSSRLLRAVGAEGKVREILSGGFIMKHGLKAASSVKSALMKLIDNELICHSADGYMVYDRFMGEWLRRNVD